MNVRLNNQDVPLETIFKCLCRSYGAANAEIEELKYNNEKLQEEIEKQKREIAKLTRVKQFYGEYRNTMEESLKGAEGLLELSRAVKKLTEQCSILKEQLSEAREAAHRHKCRYEKDMAELMYNYSKSK